MDDSYRSFLKEQAYINGEWCLANNGSVIAVTNPSNQDVLAHVPNMGAVETHKAIDSAATAFLSWSQLTSLTRANYLLKLHDLMLANKEALAGLLTCEQGKPLQEAIKEIEYSASYFRWFAEEARRVCGDVISTEQSNQRQLVIKQPVGIVAAITPWNFPSAMIGRKCAAALAVGCTVIVKPSEFTPFSALALAELAERAGIPPGVINVVTGDASAIGQVLCQDPRVRKLTFTGSVRVGKLLYAQCADTMKKLSMELGGNAPFIVFNDADIEHAVSQLMCAKFRNSGQACSSANRIFVQSDIYDQFVAAFLLKVKNISLGDGLSQPPVLIGPLINKQAITKIQALVDLAVNAGAKILCGGAVNPLGPNFYTPTVIVDANISMDIAQNEIFGPVAVIYRFETEKQVIDWANSLPVGLASYCFTLDFHRIWRLTEQLKFGIVSINSGSFANATIPFGGMKDSGLGREGSKYGLDDYLDIKYICLDVGTASV